MDQFDTTTHVAGPLLKHCDRLIQRCAICGEKLYDSADVTEPGESSFVEKQLVQMRAWGPKCLGEYQDKCWLPPDFCIDLVELSCRNRHKAM
jgi:hypothetical protein